MSQKKKTKPQPQPDSESEQEQLDLLFEGVKTARKMLVSVNKGVENVSKNIETLSEIL